MHRKLEGHTDLIIFAAVMVLAVSSGLSIMWAISNGRATFNIDETFLTSALTSFMVDVINLGVSVKLAIRDNMLSFLLKSIRSGKLNKKEAQGAQAAITENKGARKSLIISYLFVGSLAIACNIIYAFHKIPDNGPLAVLVGIMPFALISICTLVLRAIPLNYEQLAHEVINDALIGMVQAAKKYVMRFYTMRNPSDAQKQLFAAAVGTISLLADAKEAKRFQIVAAQMSGVPQIASAQAEAIDVTSEDVLSAQDVADRLHIPLRTAQHHLQRYADSVKIGASYYIKTQDLAAIRARLRKPRAKDNALEIASPGVESTGTQEDATEMQTSATVPQLDAIETQVTVQPA